MKNCGIVCEYNPFHTGHKYQLDCVRKAGADNIVCVMSGSFVQSAMPAFCDKALRAKCAVSGGADAVIELPTVYATASAQIFAEGAVKIMREVKDLTHIAMGARGDADAIKRLADIKINKKSEFENALKNRLEYGKSYNAASTEALAEIYEKLYTDKANILSILNDPNNILCIEYISAIARLGADIEPIVIERKGAAHNDTDTSSEHISATAIRNAYSVGSERSVRKYIPYFNEEIDEWQKSHAPDLNLYKNIVMFALKCAKQEDIKSLRNCSEGLEYSVKSLSKYNDYDAVVDEISGKRYAKKRVQRLLYDVVLGIDKNVTDKKFITRLLACKKTFDFTIIPQTVKTDNASIKAVAKQSSEVAEVLDIDVKAVSLYNTVCNKDGDYFNYSVVKL